ncbi:T9SS type A sorting domain-containing protein [Lacibacter luteus]|uniref:T9SS type A sorting domain-containing protein n=1 Tax=Lacibacter luteus TaxID=2508719 RepID=A0A4Q1CHZ0_9BACT|nr:T9SS type A sorting domain-containing protein [Lacibacter luteus]RXK59978.1 T9SS type A sorting domain-containing protein [Lacibacter luteus]
MKQLLLSLFLLLIIGSKNLSAQITSPQIKAGFGIDAELRSNFFNGFLQVGNDDWFSQNVVTGSGVGEFIIDTTGAAYIVSRYASTPSTRMLPFFRNMRFPQFSVVNGRLLIDAVFIRDHHGDDSTVFASGSNKNGMNPNTWTTPVSQGIPDKNDILDMFMHVRREGTTTADSLWLFGGVSIDNTTGNRYFDFEMYQTDIYYDKPSLKFYGYGPDDGHTSWQFDASGNITRTGDIILTAEYGSSNLSFIEARIWVHKDALLSTPNAFNWSGSFDGAGSGATYGYAGITPKTAGNFYSGLQSSNGTWAGPFSLVLQNNSVTTTYAAKQFMEFSVNLSKLGLDPLVTSNDICGLPFRRILVKSRASTSFTAELKDFVGPFSFFRAPRADVATDFPSLCPGGAADIWVTNALATSQYTWFTTNGNIVGSNVGDRINVDQPGTYVVSQVLMDSCGSTYATDTIQLTMQNFCEVLTTKPYNLNARLQNKTAWVNWNTSSEEGVAYYELQRSYNGRNYYTVGNRIPPRSGGAYLELDDLQQCDQTQVFYRVKYVASSGGKIYYTNAVRLYLRRNNNYTLTVAPNPVHEQFRISFTADRMESAEITITNSSGALVHRTIEQIKPGTNEWQITNTASWSNGQYIVQVKLGNEVFRKRLIVSHQ